MRKRRNGAGPAFIESEDDIRAGVRALRRKCAAMRLAHDHAGDPPLRRHRDGFEGLARIVVGQQLSLQSAEAIWRRVALLVTPMRAEKLLKLDDDTLRGAGLSRGKVRTLRVLSSAIADGDLDLAVLAAGPEEELRTALMAVSGIGPWTADIYLLFCAGKADAFAPGDLALQVAAQMAFGLDARPSAQELADIAERWRPWRGVAAHLLWAYYKVAKSASSGAPV